MAPLHHLHPHQTIIVEEVAVGVAVAIIVEEEAAVVVLGAVVAIIVEEEAAVVVLGAVVAVAAVPVIRLHQLRLPQLHKPLLVQTVHNQMLMVIVLLPIIARHHHHNNSKHVQMV
jgi:hypothetical protein